MQLILRIAWHPRAGGRKSRISIKGFLGTLNKGFFAKKTLIFQSFLQICCCFSVILAALRDISIKGFLQQENDFFWVFFFNFVVIFWLWRPGISIKGFCILWLFFLLVRGAQRHNSITHVRTSVTISCSFITIRTEVWYSYTLDTIRWCRKTHRDE